MKNKIYITILLCLGFLFAQSDLGREAGEILMQNQLIDSYNSGTGSVTTVTHAEAATHDGNHFNIGGSFSLGSGDTSLIVFDVADTTKYSHMVWEFSSTVGATILIIEGGEVVRTPDGITIVNNDRNSETVSVMDTVYVIHNDSTLVTRYGADTLRTHTLGALQKSGGELNRATEWILKNDSLLMFKVTANAGSEVFDYLFDWIEHTDLNE